MAFDAERGHGDIPELLDALACSSCSYDEWLRVGMGLKASGFPFELWDTWSARDADRYSQRACEERWDGFKDDGGVTASTVAHICKEHGIDVNATPRRPSRHDCRPAKAHRRETPEPDRATIEPERRLIRDAAEALKADKRARALAADYLGSNAGITVDQAVERGIGVVTPEVLAGFESGGAVVSRYHRLDRFGCSYWMLFPVGDSYHIDRDISQGWRERSTKEYRSSHEGYHKALKPKGIKQPDVCNPSALEADVCFIVEGYPDMLAVESHGYHATPLLSSTCRGTVQALRESGRRAVVMTDNDVTGRKTAGKIAGELKGACPCVTFEWPDGAPKDAGEWNATDPDGLGAALSRAHDEAMAAEVEAASEPGESGNIDKLRGARGGLLANAVAKEVMRRDHARIIDGTPAVWTGSRWEFGNLGVSRCVLDIADDASSHVRNEVLNYIMLKAPAVSSDTEFDGKYYVQFADATLDVRENKIVNPRPDMFIIGTICARYGELRGQTVADVFLEAVSGGDMIVFRALCEVIGACICSKRCASQAPMLIGRAGGYMGKASNGKSTFINWLRAILGPANVSSLDPATMGQRFQAGQTVGKLANLGDDIPNSFISGKELATLKKMVTGDSVYTDVKGASGYTFKPTATPVFSMNDIPRIGDSSEGVMRRLSFIPFRRSFKPGDEGFDPDIARKLAQPEALTAGAMLGVAALPDLIERGRFIDIPDMKQELEEVRYENNSVEIWLREMGISDKDVDNVPTASLHTRYVEFCADHHIEPYGLSQFTRKVLESDYFPFKLDKKSIRPKEAKGKVVQGFYIPQDEEAR